MKLSCADFTFPLLPHDDALELIRMLGITGVDLGVFSAGSHLQSGQVVENPARAAVEINARLASHGLELADVFLQTGEHPALKAANSPDSSVRKEARMVFLKVLEFAAATGAEHMTGLPGVSFAEVENRDSLGRSAEEAAWRVAEARKAGIAYAVEPHAGSIAPTPQAAAELVRLAEGLTLTLDYGHFIYGGFSNEEIHPLLPLASHFHARGGAPKRLQVAMNENAIHFPEILRRLALFSYPGWICLEYVWGDWEGCNRTDNVSETVLLRDIVQGEISRIKREDV
ncbi:MAG: TIM barrel protein [Terrimicrobiaceae bacterium]|jgi:sugar phosphate isomerase/epimerase|nr:sugar phosphate isomerase/epimerase [Terrimicrobiaceae bacterium]